LVYAQRGSGAWRTGGVESARHGAHFYEVYETEDGGFIAVGAIEPEFYAALLRGMALDQEELPAKWTVRAGLK